MISSTSDQRATSHAAFVDNSTHLMNAASPEHAFTISYIDITGFKKFNDHYGYAAGDQLLSDLENTLRGMRRTALCSRVFSDHFLRLARYDSRSETLAFLVSNMEETLLAFEARQAARYPDCALSFSCGYCQIEGGAAGLVQAIDDANLARKEAKALGVTRAVWFDQSIRQRLAQQERLEVEIRSGLRNSQFTFYLQPKVDLHTGVIVGAEALARWTRPDGRQISPDQFIPLMEETDLVLSLDRLIFRQVCDYLRDRLREGRSVVPISVNMSRRHIWDPDFPAILHRMAQDRSIPPYLLEIELTETVLFTDMEKVRAAISQLRSYGYQVSIDDFGTGYTGMSLWRDMEFDTVKLDRSYIISDPDRAEALRNDIVVTSLAYISRQFNTRLLCEGPETAEQCAHMAALGCDIAQGYYFSPPLCRQKFDQLLEAGPFPLPYRKSWDSLPQYSKEEMTTLRSGREVLDLAGCAILILRPDEHRPEGWKWVDLNQSAAALYGFPDPETALRQGFDPVHDFTDPADLPQLLALLNAPPDGTPTPTAFRIASVSRRRHYLSGTIRWASTQGGGPFCLMTLMDDTQRHETVLAKLELANLVESLPTSLFRLTLDPGGEHAFQFFSHRIQNLLGYSPGEYELLQRAHMEWSLIPAEEQEHLRSHIRTSAQNQDPIDVTFHAITKSGHLRRLSLSAAFTELEGESLVYTGMLTNVTSAEEKDLPSDLPRPDMWSYDFDLDTLFLPASEHSSGLPLNGLTQMSLTDFFTQKIIAPEDQPAYRHLLRQIREGADMAQAILQARGHGDKYLPFKLVCRPTAWDKQGRPVEMTGISVPI